MDSTLPTTGLARLIAGGRRATVVMLAGLGLLAAFACTGAAFTAKVSPPSSALASASLDTWLPTGVAATRNSRLTCHVTWTAADGTPDGGTYDVTDGTTTVATGISGTTATVAVPSGAVTPQVHLRLGTWVSATGTPAAAICPGYPDAPTTLTATQGDGQITWGWTAPSGNGAALMSYTLTSTGGSCITTPPTTTCTITGLTNGTAQTATVTATNTLGTSLPSTPATSWAYPSSVMTSGATKLWLDGADPTTLFSASGCTGGNPSTNSAIGCWKDKSTQANNATQATGGKQPTTSTLNGLNAPAFDGSTSELTLADVTKLPVGANPSSVYTVSSQDALSSSGWRWMLTWGDGSLNHGRGFGKEATTGKPVAATYINNLTVTPIWPASTAALYNATTSATSQTLWLNATNQATMAGLSVNTLTTLGAKVGNAVWGSGEYWQGHIGEIIVLAKDATTTDNRAVQEYLARKWGVAITPRAPTGVSATGGDAQANVSWTAPSWDGGASITGYTVTSSPGGLTCSASPATAASCTVTGLTNGTSYTFTVTAANSAGTGTASAASNSVTPVGPPGPPAPVSAIATDAAAVVTFTAPASSTGGSAITGYTVTSSPGGRTASGTSSPLTVTGLTNGTTYTFTATATNAIGTGTASSASNAVTPLAAVSASISWAGSPAWGVSGTGTADQSVPVQVGAATTWTSTPATGNGHSCAVRSDGSLWCWGQNTSGQVGAGDTLDRTSPTRVDQVTTWSSVDAGYDHTCALRTGGTLWCWGENGDGQLGVGNSTDRTAPTQVGAATTWARVSAGVDHTCAVRTDGTLWCWGSNSRGQLGTGGGPTTSPTQVGVATTWATVSAGNSATCAVRTDGTLWCWGVNIYGQLGLGDTTTRWTPVQVGSDTTWGSVESAIGEQGSFIGHTCAVKTDGTLWCWGTNGYGQLGVADWTERDSPTQVGSATTWATVTTGENFTCATRTAGDGTAWCWGNNPSGQLGRGDTAWKLSPAQVGSATTWAAFSGGANHACGRRTDGTLWCWGSPSRGRLGTTIVPSATARPVGTTTSWSSIATVDSTTCAIRSDGTLWCWGNNGNGQLGQGDRTNRSTPTQVGTATSWRTVTLSPYHACATRTNGTLWCWGVSWSYQLGLGDTTEHLTPTQVGTAATWLQVSAGYSGHTCAVRTDGTLWCWSNNSNGQLGMGVGDTSTRYTPTQVGAGATWAAVSAGDFFTCATKTDGTLWCWGANSFGALGTGNQSTYTVPTQAGSATTWASVKAGTGYACGTRTDGTLWCWGLNSYATLGVGDYTLRTSPTQIGSGTTWTAVAVGTQHACGTRSGGTLWCWGTNVEGQLGRGDQTTQTAPVQVSGVSGAAARVDTLAAGGDTTFALAAAPPALSLPSAPTEVQAVVNADGSVDVNCTAPASDGGSAITSYMVTASPSGTTSSGSSCYRTLWLTKGATYTFTVTASTAIGTGPASAPSAAVLAVSAPGAPTTLTATAADGQITWSWAANADTGGLAITGYSLTMSPSGSCTTTAPTTSCTITGLTNGTLYTAGVTATNSVGTGAASSSVTARPYPASVMSASATKLWLDAADTSTVFASSACTGATPSTGAAVGCWKDKSSSANLFNTTTGTGAVTSASAINGITVPSFDGSGYLSTASGFTGLPTGTNPSAVYAVTVQEAPTNAGWRWFFSWGGTGNGTGRGFGKLSNSLSPTVVLIGNNVEATRAWPSAPSAAAAVYNATTTATSESIWLNGGNGATSAASPSTGTTYTTIGTGGWATTQTWQGRVAEVIVVGAATTTTQDRAVQEYLARKWGVAITPQAPTGVTGTGLANGNVTVSWTAPAWDGGSAVTSYTATAAPGGQTCTANFPATTCTITAPITSDSGVTVSVTATNSAGTGPASTASAAITTVPGTPTVTATQGDGQLTWTVSAATGGSTITGYTITHTGGTCTLTPPTAWCTVTGLTNGVVQTATATATNAVGTGAASSSVTSWAYPAAVMTSTDLKLWLDGADPATLFSGSGCTGTVTTTIGCWTDKSTQGNNATQATGGNQPTLSSLNGLGAPTFDGSASKLGLTVGKLPTATTASAIYTVAVQEDTTPTTTTWRHVISWGSGSGSQGRALFKAYHSTRFALDTMGTYALMSPTKDWPTSTAAIANGTITSSSVSAALNGAANYTTTGMTNNTGTAAGAYVGVGAWAPSELWKGRIAEIIVVQTATTTTQDRLVQEYLARKWGVAITPQAPTSPTATGGDAQATVSWTAPAWNGGSAVTSYTVTASPGGATCSTASTSCAVTGLTNGTSYTFTVTATNSVGTGPASAASNAVTPYTVPGAPTGLTATPGDGQIAWSWTAPGSTGGSAITGYTLTLSPGGATCSAASSPCTTSSLTNGVAYTATVTATNVAGTGAASSSVTTWAYPATVMNSTDLKLWLDGADASTLFSGSGCTGTVTSTIGCWKDKSTQGDNATQATGGNQPTLSALNSLGAPMFNGTSSYLSLTPNKLPSGTNPSAIYAVAVEEDATPATQGWRFLMSWGNGGGTGSRSLAKKDNSDRFVVELSGNPYNSTRSWVSNTPAIVNATVAGTGLSTWLNGAWSETWSGTPNTTLGTAYLGSWLDRTVPWKGRIAEVVIVQTATTPAQDRTVQEYLARKWGVPITPAAPTIGTATKASTTSVAVTWTAPTYDGGAAVTGYTVTSSGGQQCTTTGATTCTVTGLTTSTAYTFTLTATNAVGTGPASAASNSATPS